MHIRKWSREGYQTWVTEKEYDDTKFDQKGSYFGQIAKYVLICVNYMLLK